MITGLLIDGIALGAAYALCALGFALALGAAGTVNFAHGDLVVAGGFLTLFFLHIVDTEGSLLPVVIAASLISLLGMTFGSAISRWLRRSPIETIFVATLVGGLVLRYGILALSGPLPQTLPPLVMSENIDNRLAMIIIVITIIIALWLWLQYSQRGRRTRAVAQDPEMASALGIPARWITAMSFALALSLTMLAGSLLAHPWLLTPDDGPHFMIKSYFAVVLGGWGRIEGAALAGFLIGLFETIITHLATQPLAEALLFMAIIIVLISRGQGLIKEYGGTRS